MSDDDIESAEARKMGTAKHRVAVDRIRAQWRRDGYNPRAHLEAATGEGDRNVLVFMMAAESDNRRTTRNFAVWLAWHDLVEARHVRRIDGNNQPGAQS